MKISNPKHILLLVIAVFLAGTVALLTKPGATQLVSPDGRLIARITFPSVLTRLSTKQDQNWSKRMRVRLQVTDTQTGESVKAFEHTLSYLLGDGGEYPRRLIWSSDSKQLIYEVEYEVGQGKSVFRVQVNPLRTHMISKEPGWM